MTSKLDPVSLNAALGPICEEFGAALIGAEALESKENIDGFGNQRERDLAQSQARLDENPAWD